MPPVVDNEMNQDVLDASAKFVSQRYPILNELLETIVSHAVGQLLIKYRFAIKSGESTVKLALLDHKNAGVLLDPYAVRYVYNVMTGDLPSEEAYRTTEVVKMLEPVIEGMGLKLQLERLGLEVGVQRPHTYNGRHIVLQSADA